MTDIKELKDEELEQVVGGDLSPLSIDEIKVNDIVWALDTCNGLYRWGKVIDISINNISIEFGGGFAFANGEAKTLKPNIGKVSSDLVYANPGKYNQI